MVSEQTFWHSLERFGSGYVIIFVVAMLVTCAGIAFVFWLGHWKTNRLGRLSPIEGEEMAPGELLSFSAVEKIRSFLLTHDQPENAPFEPIHAAICRKSGRVYPNARDRFGVIVVGKDYLSRRYPKASWMQWEELLTAERDRLVSLHGTFRGFDREGLHADPSSNLLIGWKQVPETDLKVLIIQKP